jgi:hypothetical protein
MWTHPNRSKQQHSDESVLLPSVGLLYLYSAERIRSGTANGLEAALGTHFYDFPYIFAA